MHTTLHIVDKVVLRLLVVLVEQAVVLLVH
jgi:hypothetical protein